MLTAGPLADKILEPAMQDPQSILATTTGWFMGTGPGRGMALLFVLGGCIAALVGICGYVFRNLRDVDILLPDHDTLPDVLTVDERLTRMQELLEDRKSWVSQPASPERELALKAISNSLRKLGQGASIPPETV
jgi:hypothetical protein